MSPKLIDQAILAIAADPAAGHEKNGALAEISVYKFKLNKQEILLAYRLQPSGKKPHDLVLLALGSHENFCSTIKR